MSNKKLNNIIIVLLVLMILILAYIFLFLDNDKITSIELDNKNITLLIGESKTFAVNVLPNDEIENIIWESSDSSVATIEGGKVMGLTVGNAIVTAHSKSGNVSDTCIVRVIKNEVERIELSDDEIELNVGNEREITTIISPSKLQNTIVTWESSNENVAVVEGGKITGIGNGEATITAYAGSKQATCDVSVTTLVESIKFEKENLSIEEDSEETINILFTPETTSNKLLKWESSDPNIATVYDGIVYGIKEGNVIITATTIKGEKTATCAVKITSKPKYTIKYVDLNKKVTKKQGETLGTLPVTSKKGYKFLGWYTKESGGIRVTSSTIVTGKMNLYAHWESLYVITNDSSRTSGLSLQAQYNSGTLKYRIYATKNGYYTTIWVSNANKQINTALANYPKLGHQGAADMLNAEISRRGYKNKGMVAINGSFSKGEAPGIPVIMTHGQIIKTRFNDGLLNHDTVGIDRDGNMVCYLRDTVSVNTLQKRGIRNTFGGNYCLTDKTSGGGSDTTWKTVLCQVDERNFAILTGSGRTTLNAEKEMQDRFGCRKVVNLDGGGSTRLYYKYNNMSSIRNMYKSARDPERKIVDTLYFVE